MKKEYCKQKGWIKPFLMLVFALLITSGVYSQSENILVEGVIKDDMGETLIGASVVLKENSVGTVTDLNGKFELMVPSDGVLVISYVGFTTREVSVNGKTYLDITLRENEAMLKEVVVIGYGSVKREDLTGSVTAIKVEEMNKGLSTSPQDLLGGKIAGVTVVSGGGQPGAGSTIRIRGGSSLSATNDPLIVIDGVIIANETVEGLTNGLSTINPADIETFTVLKDASATAIYGSRASNGVIIITTKKGKGGKVRLSYNGNITISTSRKKIDVLDGNEYRELINSLPYVNDAMKAALEISDQSTNWQNEVLRTAISTDHNISALGSVNNFMPYRVSFGYTNESGILKTSNFERFTGSFLLNPLLFDAHLKIDLNAKGSYIKNRFADTGAVGSAVFFDPTKPVYNDNDKYGGYYTWTNDGTPNGSKQGFANNPVAMLKQKDDKSTVKAFVGSAQFDYKLHFLPDLSINMNMAYDYSNSDGGVYIAPNSQMGYGDINKSGSQSHYENTYKNSLFESYAKYAKELPSIQSRFDVMGGYSYQSYKQDTNSKTYYLSRDPERYGEEQELTGEPTFSSKKQVLISFYGRANYTLMDRYLFTFTLRNDGSSRFAKGKRWGTFPSLALGWKMKDESFLKDVNYLSSLKLRLGWGKTGQQDIGKNWYPSTLGWSWGKGGAMFPVYDANGNVTWVNVVKPVAATPELKWEVTTTWNAAFDYGFLNNRINGSLDFYYRKTKDLLNAEVEIPAGKDFAEVKYGNIGSLTNKGVEFTINATPIDVKDFSWDLSYNIAYNKSEITELTFNDAINTTPGMRFESTGGDGGKRIKIHSVGYTPGMFYVYEQVYDENGKPIEGAYVDRNNDGKIDDRDLYRYKNSTPKIVMGFGSKFIYKSWDLGFNGRVSLGNYMYNAVEADNGGLGISDLFGNNTLTNRTHTAVENGFKTKHLLSDYYVQNASFLKIDNITLGYSFNKRKLRGRVFGTVTNPIVITKYDGIDPEVFNGMDRNVYPRPISFIMGVNFNL